jgi:hypothetical protein
MIESGLGVPLYAQYFLRFKILVVIDFFLQFSPFSLFKKLFKYNLFCLLYVLMLHVF